MSSFFFNDPATTEIYTLSLHDALPIFHHHEPIASSAILLPLGSFFKTRSTVTTSLAKRNCEADLLSLDRKSTRLNSSHSQISYAVFCLKKKKKQTYHKRTYK